MIGIYKITNLTNNKSYIGQSVNIQGRWTNECTRAFNPNSNSYNTPLSRALRKYGINNFSFEVVEECAKDELDTKERYYIYLYQTLVPLGYNVATGGALNASHSIKLSYDQVLEIVKLLKESTMTQLEIAELYSISKDSVTDINLGYTWNNPLETYPLRQARKKHCERCGKVVSSLDVRFCAECIAFLNRKVERPSKEDLLYEIANSSFVQVGKKYGVSDKAIVKWCKAYGLPIHKKEIVELYKNSRR